MWRKIDMNHPEVFRNKNNAGIMFTKALLKDNDRHAVDRSQGGLVEIDIWYFGTDELLNYIADRSGNLRILKLILCYQMTHEGFAKAVEKLPLLEYLEVSHCCVSGLFLRLVGHFCPNLRTFKLNSDYGTFSTYIDDRLNNEDALAIARSMPKLFHLELFGNFLTNEGLKAILDGCAHLEYLDLRGCFNLDLTGDLEKRCIERIKDLKRPYD